MSFWNTTVDFFTGDASLKEVADTVNWGGVANIAGSYFLNRAFDSGGPDAGGGYQGDVPDYTAVRSRVANTYDPNRRPGSGGLRYFSDMQYVEPYAPTTPEIDQAVADAGDTTTDDATPSTEGLAALDVVRQIADQQAKVLEEQNAANPAYEAKPTALNTTPTGATGIQAAQAKNAATAGSGVNSLLPVPQYDAQGNTVTVGYETGGAIDAFIQGGKFLQDNPFILDYLAKTAAGTGIAGLASVPAFFLNERRNRKKKIRDYMKGKAEGGVVGYENGGMARGGIAKLAVGGRYLDGMTDGMADEVPANIDGKQPAALSDGEFVVPADVVSHLGNGNSNAGAKALHDMMANVRQDRTGNAKQGTEINATDYIPKVG